MMRRHECAQVEVGWQVIAHDADPAVPLPQSSVAWVPYERVRLAEGVVAHVPTEQSRAWEALIFAKDDCAAVGVQLRGLPILADHLRAGVTYLRKRWAPEFVEPYGVFRP